AERLGKVALGVDLHGEDPDAAAGGNQRQGRGDGGLARAPLAGDKDDPLAEDVIEAGARTRTLGRRQSGSVLVRGARDGGEDLTGVSLGLDLSPFALHPAVRPDQERGAFDAHVAATVLRLGDPELEEVEEAAIGITDQRDAQVALGRETLVAL